MDDVLAEWTAAVKAGLGIDLEVDRSLLLSLAGDAAHGVARPAAPLTTFLVGYAAGRAGGGPDAVAAAARRAGKLAARWAAEEGCNRTSPSKTPGGTR
ncbi:DUF6457 domain-containing protein [Streptomyces sp. NPDC058731]|uniref:DUF6457 domain-containing protein n=1 Tax=Streptomyces sp. NPDC058731 TaxID=3346613 RepID=UPI00369A42C6